MKTVAITAGVNVHRKWAGWLAERINKHASVFTDAITCLDISEKVEWKEIGNPVMVKLRLWQYVGDDIERILWIDADCFVTRPIYEHELPTFPISAVSIIKGHRLVRRKDGPVIARLANFFNGGVILSTREGKRAFDHALEIEKESMLTIHRCQDERLLNLTSFLNFAHLNSVGWHDMGTDWNNQSCHARPTQNTVIIHFDGEKNRDSLLSGLYSGKLTYADITRPRAVRVGKPSYAG